MRQPAGLRRVLYVSTAGTLWGAERSLLLLVASLPRHGWRPIVACPPGRLADAARGVGVDVVEIAWRPLGDISDRSGGRKRYPLGRVWSAARASLANARTVARIARAVDADVVVSNSYHAHPYVTLGARLARRPPVWHLRDIVAPGPGRRALDLMARASSGVIAISAAVAATIRRPTPRVVPNPVASPAPGPAPRWAGDGPIVGFLGRIDARKGLEDLIAAAGRVGRGRIVVVGAPLRSGDGYLERLRAEAEAQAPGRVSFVGRTEDPAAALAAFDVCVVPSHNEPWGRVAAEALAVGTPVVAARAGGLVEIVSDGDDGVLYPPGDIDALVAAIDHLLDDDARRASMGARGREHARRFDPDAHAAGVGAFLMEVVDG